MKIVKGPKIVKCTTCECEMEITSKDVWVELSDRVSTNSEVTSVGKKFVKCPICNTKVYL